MPTDIHQYPSDLPARPAFCTTGKAVAVRVNQYKLASFPNNDIYQYDVSIGTGAEKMGKIMFVWKSNQVQNKLKAAAGNECWLWDGNKLAWNSTRIPEQRILVDLDAERGRAPRPGKESEKIYCHIRQSKVVRLSVIAAYLNQQTPFDNAILEAINFLDHAIRQGPSEKYTCLKRSFFTKGITQQPLDNVIVAMKGVYSSIRLCSLKPSVGGTSTGLALNVDVANGTFWTAQDVHQAARNFLKDRNRNLDWNTFKNQLLPIKRGNTFHQSEDFKTLRKMGKLKFKVKYPGKQVDKKVLDKEHRIKGFTFDASKGPQGANAKTVTFNLKTPDNPNGHETSVFDYYKMKYGCSIQMWNLPLITTERDGMFPMELCQLVPNQQYKFKLSPDQTSAMIKFAVTRPQARIGSINHGVGMLSWNTDKYLNHYQIKVENQMTLTNARLLQNPEIAYAGAKVNPGTAGRWDLRGKKFLLANPEPLTSWGVCVIQNACDEATVKNFLNVFIQTYIGHGGKVTNKNPAIYFQGRNQDLADTAMSARLAAGNQSKSMPQIILYVLPGRDSFTYERLKKNMECRFALVSQMLNVQHVRKAQPQYCSNVCMKLNAKLGGTTCKVVGVPNANAPAFPRPTMVIGADVSHPTPGSPQPSMAALTMSFDQYAARYAAAVQTNGYRTEMISENNVNTMFIPLFKQWVGKVGGGNGPQHIYYFRDGVSEGQYAHVLDKEVHNMKEALFKNFGEVAKVIKWTVIVCTKRHHIRFFPKENDTQAGDRNGNPLPGTLVEKDVTHPFEYDFYLSSHSAIQGTARPVHYHVILDEAKVAPNDLHMMIYRQCYQYMRSTTPVSLYPAVYYAHLASNRARAHESAPASEGPRGGQKFEEARIDAAVRGNLAQQASRGETSQSGSQPANPSEAKPLLPLGDPTNNIDVATVTKIRTGMWYI
ncbi:Piwi domain-containing protein [Halenospora varia]|nr:Piwi domain-containing protein [Halenospora varia]